jgi:hypothetical protein
MAGGGGKGIDWMINLDAKTQGAVDVINALGKTKSAADLAGAAIDRALNAMEKMPKAGDAGWSKGLGNLKALTKGAQLTDREFGAVQARTAQAALELEHLGAVGEKSVTPLWKEVLKGELAMHALEKGAEIAKEAIMKTGEVLWEAMHAAGQEQRVESVFKNMLGEDEAEETLEYLEKFADMSEFTDDAIKGFSASLLQVGLRGADFRNALGAAIDVAGTGTNKIEAMGSAVESLSRIARTGRIDNRSLGGLKLNAAEVTKQLADDLKMTPDVIKKKLEEGTLKGAEAMGSIYTVMERRSKKALGGVGDDMSKLFEARFEKLKDVPEELFKGVKTSQGFQDISDTFERIKDLFSPGSEAGNRIQGVLIKTLDIVGEKFKAIDWEKVSGGVSRIAEGLTSWIEPLGLLLGVLGELGKAIAGLAMLPRLGEYLGDWAARTVHSELNTRPGVMVGRGVRGDVDLGKYDGLPSMAQQESDARIESAGVANGKLADEIFKNSAVRTSGQLPAVPTPTVGELGKGTSQTKNFNAGGVNVHVNVNTGGSSGTPAEIGKEAAAQSHAAILSALEQFNVSAGLA